MNEIVTRCLAMSRKNRQHLIAILTDSLEDNTMIQERFQMLLGCATMLMGDGILSASRDLRCCLGRYMISYQMHKEGYGWSEIGKLMGRRHSSIISFAKRMEEFITYKVYYKNENALWEEFQNMIRK